MAWKRFAIVVWVFAYTGLIGVPVWWATTTLERPQLPEPTSLHLQPLPITFHVTVVAKEHGHLPKTPQNFQTALQADAEQAFILSGLAASKGSDIDRPLIIVNVASTVSPELCATPPPSSTEPPSYPPSSEDLEHLRVLEDASEHAAPARRTSSNSQTPPGHFNVFIIQPNPDEDPDTSEAAESSIAWLGASRSAWVWLQGNSIDGAARCAIREVFRTVLHGFGDRSESMVHSAHAGGGQGRLPVSAASELTCIFCLAIAEPPLGVASWSIDDVVQGFWAPITSKLAPLMSLRVETQQRLHARGRVIDSGAARSSQGGVRLSEAAIPFFVDPDAWALESGRIVTGHTHPLAPDFHGIAEKLLHFVGYVPAAEEQPMLVDCGAAAAGHSDCMGFVVAQWGGVVLLNNASKVITRSRKIGGFTEAVGEEINAKTAEPEDCAIVDTGYRSLNTESVEAYLGLAAQQFRDMLHLRPAENVFLGLQKCSFSPEGDWAAAAAVVSGAGDTGRCSGGVFVVSPGADVIALWEIDLLMRKRFSQLIQETEQSLRSLMQLVVAAENLEIPSFIGDKLRLAQHQAEAALTEARNGGSYKDAMLAATRARINAEVAQSHHAIATHHSYPAQHKIALYLPLFAPLSLPLIVTLVREVRRKLNAGKQA